MHRVIQRESGYNPGARNGPYYGLMQILPQTARTMGYTGSPEGLLDPETNLMYAGKYLRGAWLVSRGDEDEAVGWYARGYYYEAKRKGLLGALRTATTTNPAAGEAPAAAQPPAIASWLASVFSPQANAAQSTTANR